MNVAEIDRRRQALGLSHAALCARARVDYKTWGRARHAGIALRPSTLQRLASATDETARRPPPNVIRCLVAAVETILAAQVRGKANLSTALAWSRPRNELPTTVSQSRMRRVAIYLVAVELCIGNAEIARALNVSRQNIKQARDQVEKLRDDPAVNRLFARIGEQLTNSGD